MKYTIYEHPITHQFAHAPLPSDFLEGDAVPTVVTDRWFDSHHAAVAALSEILDREAADTEPAAAAEPTDAPVPLHKAPPVVWLIH